jgi:hypothetical protein
MGAAEPNESSWPDAPLDPAALRALNAGLAPSALWSLLLGVADRRAGARGPADLARQWQHDRFVAPSGIDQRRFLAIDRVLFDAASAFDAIELSPLAPLAACHAVAPGSQHRIVTTMRGTEVVSDPTNVLALECACRLAEAPTRELRLATSHRCVRAQPVPPGAGFAAHFRLFCLATAGHERKNHGLLLDALAEQIAVHLRALDALEAGGFAFGRRSLRVLASDAASVRADILCERVRAAHPLLELARAPLASTYYDGLRFMIDAQAIDGTWLPLIDGGAFDWLRRLANNRKLVFVASAIGTQLLAARLQAD